MQWPTMYYLNGHDDPSYSDQNIPVYIPNSDRKGKYRSLQLENQRTHYLSEIQIHHDKNKYNNDDDDLMKELHDYSTPLMGEFTKKSNELILRGEARTRTRSSIKSDMEEISVKISEHVKALSQIAPQMDSYLKPPEDEVKRTEFPHFFTSLSSLRKMFRERTSNTIDKLSTTEIPNMHHMTGHLLKDTNEFMTSFNELGNTAPTKEYALWHSIAMRLLDILRLAATFLNFYAHAHYRADTTLELISADPDLSGRTVRKTSDLGQIFDQAQKKLFGVYTSGQGDLYEALRHFTEILLLET
eukprot:7271911-Prymnesium_polylepis.1